MKFLIKQANSSTRSFEDFPAIYAVTGKAFQVLGGSAERFADTEIRHFKSTDEKWQHVYIMDGETCVANIVLLIKNSQSATPGKTDVVITWVNTNENYRKLGLMETLFDVCISLYERRELSYDAERFEVHPDLLTETLAFMDEHSVADGYWVLYSIVETYYAKFGFHPFTNFTYYKEKPKAIVSTGDFDLKPNEQFLTLDNFAHFILNEQYIPYPLKSSDTAERSCDFLTCSIPGVVNRLNFMLDYKNEKLEHVGLHISDSKFGESFIILGPHFGCFEVMIQRLYTSVKDESVLREHLNRLYAYISHYLKENYSKLDGYEDNHESQAVWMNPCDMFTAHESSKKVVCNFFGETKGWSYDDTNKENMAMLREFGGKPVDGLTWTYNGFYSYN